MALIYLDGTRGSALGIDDTVDGDVFASLGVLDLILLAENELIEGKDLIVFLECSVYGAVAQILYLESGQDLGALILGDVVVQLGKTDLLIALTDDVIKAFLLLGRLLGGFLSGLFGGLLGYFRRGCFDRLLVILLVGAFSENKNAGDDDADHYQRRNNADNDFLFLCIHYVFIILDIVAYQNNTYSNSIILNAKIKVKQILSIFGKKCRFMGLAARAQISACSFR